MEKNKDSSPCIHVQSDGTEAEIITPNDHYGPVSERFSFAHVFGTDSTQQDIFTQVADPLVRNVFEGYNATILAYGQTGR
jgi:hypothetical protein